MKKEKKKQDLQYGEMIFFFSCHWILLEPLNIKSSKCSCVSPCPSTSCRSRRAVRRMLTQRYTVTLFQLLQLRPNDIKSLILDGTFHLHHVWKSIPLEMQLLLRQSVWILMTMGNNISIIAAGRGEAANETILLPVVADVWEASKSLSDTWR